MHRRWSLLELQKNQVERVTQINYPIVFGLVAGSNFYSSQTKIKGIPKKNTVALQMEVGNISNLSNTAIFRNDLHLPKASVLWVPLGICSCQEFGADVLGVWKNTARYPSSSLVGTQRLLCPGLELLDWSKEQEIEGKRQRNERDGRKSILPETSQNGILKGKYGH